ncbi:hypothetical protein ACP275_12G116700 [Erythranthe tilingii]
MSSKVEVEVEVKSSAEKVWESIRESTTVFPKALPNQYNSVEVLEGDGKSVGSVRLMKYPPNAGSTEITSSKEKIEAVDEEKRSLSYIVIDGDVLKYYKNFKASLGVNAKGDGSVVKWCCEFDKADEQVPDPDIIKDFAIKSFQDLDAYILSQ